MTHGTIECINLDASVKFYREALGLDVITMFQPSDPTTSNIPLLLVRGQPGDPGKEPQISHGTATPCPDGGIAVRLADAHKELQTRRDEFDITAIEKIRDTADGHSFLLDDLDRNWWEIAHLKKIARLCRKTSWNDGNRN